MKIPDPEYLLLFTFVTMFPFAVRGSEHHSIFNCSLHIDHLLHTYEVYLCSLNIYYLYNIAAAEKKFKKLFSGSPTYIKNSAFFPFLNFYLTAADYFGARLTGNNKYSFFIG